MELVVKVYYLNLKMLEKEFTLLICVKLLHNLFRLEINAYLFIFVNSSILFIYESDDALTGERRLIQ